MPIRRCIAMNIAFCHPLVFALLLSTSACQNYQFEARAEESFTIPAKGVTTIGCTSHNGAIQIIGQADATSIEVTVAKKTNGETQALADAGLNQFNIIRQREGDGLELSYTLKKPREGWSGQASFRVVCPLGMVARAKTHNGGITLTGVGKRAVAETHNGGIEIDGECEEVVAETHNGAIEIALTGEGPVRGNVTTHNGGIELDVAESRSAKFSANTHNGSLRAGQGFFDVSTSRRSLRARLGAEDTDAVFKLSTHNGNVTLATHRENTNDVKDG